MDAAVVITEALVSRNFTERESLYEAFQLSLIF